MAISKKKIQKEFGELYDRYRQAIKDQDIESVQRYGTAFFDFIDRYRTELEIPDERFSELEILRKESEKDWAEVKRSEAEIRRLKRKLEAEEREYHRLLLEQSPEGRQRTEH